jgi:hypothetical protein
MWEIPAGSTEALLIVFAGRTLIWDCLTMQTIGFSPPACPSDLPDIVLAVS